MVLSYKALSYCTCTCSGTGTYVMPKYRYRYNSSCSVKTSVCKPILSWCQYRSRSSSLWISHKGPFTRSGCIYAKFFTLKPRPHVTSAFTFLSNVKNVFCGNKWLCPHLNFKISGTGCQRSKKKSKLGHYVWMDVCWWGKRCDLNGSVRGRVSSSRKRFWTLPNLYLEVSETKILLFSYWFFMQIGWRETLDTSEP